MLVEVSLNLSSTADCDAASPVALLLSTGVGFFCGLALRVFVSEMISDPFITVMRTDPSDKTFVIVTVPSLLSASSEAFAGFPFDKLLTIFEKSLAAEDVAVVLFVPTSAAPPIPLILLILFPPFPHTNTENLCIMNIVIFKKILNFLFIPTVLTKKLATGDAAVFRRRHAGMSFKQLPKVIRIAVPQPGADLIVFPMPFFQ